MHPINPPVREVRLIHQDGRRWHYKSLHDALQALGSSFIRTYVGRDFLVAQKGLCYDWRAQYYYPVQQMYAYDYVMRDQWGVALTHADFTELEWAARRRRRPSRSLNGLPVGAAVPQATNPSPVARCRRDTTSIVPPARATWSAVDAPRSMKANPCPAQPGVSNGWGFNSPRAGRVGGIAPGRLNRNVLTNGGKRHDLDDVGYLGARQGASVINQHVTYCFLCFTFIILLERMYHVDATYCLY